MFNVKSPILCRGASMALGTAMLVVTTTAMVAEAQSGRVIARGDRGVVAGVSGAEARAARARGCTPVAEGQACGSSAGIIGDDGAIAGRASVSEFGEDGSFDREAGALLLTPNGEAVRSLDSEINPDGSGDRSIDGYAEFESGSAERASLISVDESGNVVRSGETAGAGNLGALSTEGGGTYSDDAGLDYARESEAAFAGDNGAVYADRETAYDQDAGFALESSVGGAASNENGSVQGQSNSSFNKDDGYAVERGVTVENSEGGTLDASLSYDADVGLDRDVVCTNANGETVACVN